jgi:hypothetical protein
MRVGLSSRREMKGDGMTPPRITEAKAKPIIFSAPMILALLDGRKTQTRRLLKPQPWLSMSKRWTWNPPGKRPICGWFDGPPYIPETDALAMDNVPCAVGDRLWVRETLKSDRMENFLTGERTTNAMCAYYSADNSECLNEDGFNLAWIWKGSTLSSIHMPRWASRITLEVTGVKVERVQDISGNDAIEEGIDLEKHKCGCEVCSRTSKLCPATASGLIMEFAELWGSLHGHGAWDKNPWIYCLTFISHKCNIDDLR